MGMLRKIILPQGGGGGFKPLNQANVYANTIGTIWMTKDGQYSNRNPGEGYLWDIPSSQSGYYANRV